MPYLFKHHKRSGFVSETTKPLCILVMRDELRKKSAFVTICRHVKDRWYPYMRYVAFMYETRGICMSAHVGPS